MKYFFNILTLILICISCSQQDTGDSDPPARVRMVLKEAGFDTLEYERGIDAVSSAGNKIQVMWYSHQEKSNISKFKIYRSEEPDGSRKYDPIGSVKVQNPDNQDTIFTDQDLDLDQRYSYYVTALTEGNTESEPSDTVWYKLIEKAILLSPKENEGKITSVPIDFKWRYTSIIPDQYILRIERYFDQHIHPIVHVQFVQSEYNEFQQESVSCDWLKSSSDNGTYRWRIDCIGEDALHIGSESVWEIFNININWGKQ